MNLDRHITQNIAQKNVIAIDCSREIGIVNRQIFGVNLPGFGSDIQETPLHYGYADYGGGIWYPDRMRTVPEVITLAKDISMSAVRFNTSNYYRWKNAVGEKRKHYLYGVDEFLQSAREIGAVPIFTISYYTSSSADAANLVFYLNASCANDRIWACKRVENGHPDPYNVKYFEIGNEIIEPEYAKKYLEFYKEMKAVDPSVQIGVVLSSSERNRNVLQQIGGNVDFGIIHIYPTPLNTQLDKSIEGMNTSEIFSLTLAMPETLSEPELQAALRLLREKTGKDVPLAITEYNVGFGQSKPILYRHTLGASLVIAELLQIFMKPENGVLLATYHHFSNGHWGLIRAETDYAKHDYSKPVNYVKRPNYYVFEFYKEHFGEVLLDTEVEVSSYDISGRSNHSQRLIMKTKKGSVISENLLDGNWQIINLEGVQTEKQNGILNIDFSNFDDVNYFHAYQEVNILPDTYYKLSGYMKSVDLEDKGGVNLTIMDGRGWTKTKSVVNTDSISGTNDWQYIDVLYKTLPDAKSVEILARRLGGRGPIKGHVSIKDVKLEQFLPDTKVPYLSVNASKSIDGKKVYLMVINKNLEDGVTATIELKHFVPSETGRAWILNGPSVIATNEKLRDNVEVTYKRFAIKEHPFQFNFEPHSLTAIELSTNK